jgi:hypothetical protein
MNIPNRSNEDRRGCRHTDVRVIRNEDRELAAAGDVIWVCRGCGATKDSKEGEWKAL